MAVPSLLAQGSACPVLAAPDLEEVAVFWRELGFVETGRSETGGYLILRGGAIELHFVRDEALVPGENGRACYIHVPDAAVLFAEWAVLGLPTAGIPRLIRPVLQAWGLVEGAVIDPAGNRVRFGSVPRAVIRPVRLSDVPALIALVSTIQRDEFGIPIRPEDQPDLLDPIRFFESGGFWVAEEGSRLIGCIGLLETKDGFGILRKMFVTAGRRGPGHGTGQRLLAHVLAIAKTRALKAILLGTTDRLKAAHRFYEKNGFHPIPEAALPQSFPRMKVDTVFFRLDLV